MIRFKQRIILMLLLTLVLNSTALPLTLYVSTTGRDTNPGTAKAPFASLQAAKDHVRKLRQSRQINEPIKIIIASGMYTLTRALEFTTADSGTELSPLIIQGAAGKAPVFSGGIRLPPFQKISDRLWKADIPDISKYGGAIPQLFVNGNRAIPARTPNNGSFYKIKGVSEKIVDSGRQAAVQKIGLTTGQLDVLPVLKPGSPQIIISINHAWDRTRKYIERISTSDSAVFISGKPMKPWNRLNNSAQFYFEQARAFLDQPGEFFYDPSGTLFYIPRPGERIQSSTAVVPVTGQLLILKGRPGQKIEYLQFKNLSFQFTNRLMPALGEEPVQAAAPTDAAIMIDFAANIHFDRCEIAHTGNNAIWLRTGCRYSKITGCYFHDLGIGGVKIGEMKIPDTGNRMTGHITVDNNIIRSGGHDVPTGIGVIIFQSADNTISHNEIAWFRYTGISVGWVWGYADSPSKRNTIAFNHIHHLGLGQLSDMGGIYTLGGSQGTTVTNNVIHDISSFGYGGWGLYADEGSSGILFENNLVYNCKSSGFHQHYGRDNTIRNNIFAFQLNAQLQATRIEAHRSFSFTGNIIYFNKGKLGDSNWDKVNAVKENNIYWDTNRKIPGNGNERNAVIADPKFVNPLKHNFHFKQNAVISRIGFKPFNYTRAGVYGNKAWKRLALSSGDPLSLHATQCWH